MDDKTKGAHYHAPLRLTDDFCPFFLELCFWISWRETDDFFKVIAFDDFICDEVICDAVHGGAVVGDNFGGSLEALFD